jgi:hypothetical protein
MRELSAVIGHYNESAERALLAIDRARGYRPFVAAIPEAAATLVPAQAVYEPRVSIPVGSLLWGISAKSAQAAGFTVQVTDVATQKPLFSQPIAFDDITGGSLQIKNCYGQVQTLANPLHVLPKPMMVLAPGVLAVKVSNLAVVANRLQVCLHFALPTRAANYPNAYNQLIMDELGAAARALRDVGANSVATNGQGNSSNDQSGGQGSNTLIRVPFDIASVGDNTIIQGNSAGRITIYQLDLWNVSQQSIQLKAGATLLRGILANFPSQTGYGLAPGAKYHFQLQPGEPFIINLSAGTQTTGFVSYQME